MVTMVEPLKRELVESVLAVILKKHEDVGVRAFSMGMDEMYNGSPRPDPGEFIIIRQLAGYYIENQLYVERERRGAGARCWPGHFRQDGERQKLISYVLGKI